MKVEVYPKISNNISKLGTYIATVNLPACVSCRSDAPCVKDCYARRGNFAYPTSKISVNRNYQAYLSNGKKYFEVLDCYLTMISYKYFRWHSSGDIVDMEYLNGMVWLAKKHPKTRFLCFTKKYEIVNEYLLLHKGKKPSNLVIVFSNWKNWICDNPYNLPTSYVEFPKEKEKYFIPENAMHCSGFCGDCVNTKCSCWDMSEGDSVVFKKH